ncbi:unnamed protein product [Dicrocoelium dendriticum]|nr:unnamed protein product [Dicrocoelium dendriticum]
MRYQLLICGKLAPPRLLKVSFCTHRFCCVLWNCTYSRTLFPLIIVSNFSQGVQKLPRRRSTRTPKSKAGAAWSPGKFCICTWSEDENYYFATISEADAQSDRYLVRFCHYGNTEWKSSYELHELGSDFEPLVEDECNKLAMDKLRSTINSHSKPVMKTTVLNEVEKTTDKCATALTLGSKLHESSKDQFDKPRHAKLPDGPLNPSFSHESGPQFAQDILAGIEQLTKYTAQQSPLWNSPSGSSVPTQTR